MILVLYTGLTPMRSRPSSSRWGDLQKPVRQTRGTLDELGAAVGTAMGYRRVQPAQFFLDNGRARCLQYARNTAHN